MEFLKDIAIISAGQGAPQGDANYCENGTPFVKAGNLSELSDGKSIYDIQKVSEAVARKHKLKLYPEGTILFAKSGMSCLKGYVYVLPCDAYVVNHLACIIPTENVAEYLKYYFNYYKPNKLVKDAAYPSISLTDIGNIEIDLKDSEERRLIVTILDKIRKIIELRKQELRYLDSLVKARFVEMFGDPICNPNGYPVKNFEDISVLITDGEHATPRRTEKGIYLLSARNILNHALQLENVDYIDEDEYVRIGKRVIPKEGDVLISCSGSIGRCCVVPEDFKFQMVRSVALIRFNETINPVFAEWLITTDEIQRQIIKSATQSSQANLFQGKIRKLHGYIPPIELQCEFADFVQQINKSKVIGLKRVS